MHAVNNRIDAHIERINCHPMEIRRYYRRFKLLGGSFYATKNDG